MEVGIEMLDHSVHGMIAVSARIICRDAGPEGVHEQVACRRDAREFPAGLGEGLLTEYEFELIGHLAVLECSTNATRASGEKAGTRFLPNCFLSAPRDQKTLIHTSDDEGERFGLMIDESVLKAYWEEEELVLLNGDGPLFELQLTPAHGDPTKLVVGPLLALHLEIFGVMAFDHSQSVVRKADIDGTTPPGELILLLDVGLSHLDNGGVERR